MTHSALLFSHFHFPQLLQMKPVTTSKPFAVVLAVLLCTRCPSCRPTNGIKALKYDTQK